MSQNPTAGVVRVFVAIELPPPVITALTAVQQQLAARALPLRLSAPAGLHLTLAFIGEIPAGQVPALAGAVQQGAAGTGPFQLRAEGLGMFPNARAPRVIWAGVEGAPDAMAALTALREGIATQLRGAGFTLDRRFDPHLTLARVRDRCTPTERTEIGAAVQALPGLAPVPFDVTGVSVMRSDMRPAGAVYSRLAHVVLA
jgi:2'-5' RNA ligase